MNKNRIFYVTLTLSVGLCAAIFGDKMLYTALYSIIMLPAVSIVLAAICILGIGFSQKTDNFAVVKGHDMILRFTLKNRTLIPIRRLTVFFNTDAPGIQTSFESPICCDIKSLGVRYIEVPVLFKYWGRYDFGAYKYEFMDMLGLFKFTRKLRRKIEVVVYPKITNVEDSSIIKSLVSAEKHVSSYIEDDFSDIESIRQYTSADSNKKIHWKLSAKKGELLAKKYMSVSNDSIGILLYITKFSNISEEKLKHEDRVMEFTVALAKYILSFGSEVQIGYWGDGPRFETATANHDFHRLYSNISLIEFKKCTDFSSLLKHCSKNKIAVITDSVDNQLIQSILINKANGKNVIVFYAADAANADTDVFESAGILCKKI